MNSLSHGDYFLLFYVFKYVHFAQTWASANEADNEHVKLWYLFITVLKIETTKLSVGYPFAISILDVKKIFMTYYAYIM